MAITVLAAPAAAQETAVLATDDSLKAKLIAGEFDATTRRATLLSGGKREETAALVRWGEPAPLALRPTIFLADGSRLVTDRPWSPAGLVRLADGRIGVRRGRGWTEFDRDAVRWIVLAAEAARIDPERLDDTPLAESGGEDVVLLVDGDRLVGRVESLTAETLTLRVGGEPIEAPLEGVAAVRFAGVAEPVEGSAVLVGLDDGSRLAADRLVIDDGRFTVTASGASLTDDAERLAFVQPLGGRVRYLSDLDPVDYQHTPYLDLAWPYRRDRGLRGGPLVGGGRRAAKGVGMHSAARLVYRLDGSAQRFQAEIAVADAAPAATALGSVVFRVYLVKDGGFVPAYESGVVRTGDPAEPIDVDVTGAAALALVVDYADNGDAGDDALWLDARLVQ